MNESNSEALAQFEQGFYCAESVLLALAKHQGIESELLPKIATGLCSGMARTGGMCGALSGGILGVSLASGRSTTEETVEINYQMVRELIDSFVAKFGSTNCSELLECRLDSVEGQEEFKEKELWNRCRDCSETAERLALGIISKIEIE